MAVRLAPLFAALAAAVMLQTGYSYMFEYPDFCSWIGLISIGNNVNPIAKHGTELALVASGIQGQSNALWFPQQVNVGVGFRTHFSFRAQNPTAGGGSGFAFVMQNQDARATGSNYDGLGYAGIINSVAIEFDMFQDVDDNDPNGNHISLHAMGGLGNSAVEQQPYTLTPGSCTGENPNTFWLTTQSLRNMKDGDSHDVDIEYDSTSELLTVTLDNELTPQLSCALNLQNMLGLFDTNSSIVGFTASTGLETLDIRLLDWFVEDEPSDFSSPSTCFDGFTGNQCYAPTTMLGQNCGVIGTSCEVCLSYARSCCGWCPSSGTCENTATFGRAAPPQTQCQSPYLICPAAPAPGGLGPGAIVGIIIALIAVIALAAAGVVMYRRRPKSIPAGETARLAGGNAVYTNL